MASSLTNHLGLNKFGPSGSLGDDGYKFSLKDRELIDSLLYTLLNHDHRQVYTAALAAPAIDTPPSLSVSSTGGVLPAGRNFYYKFSYLDADGNETAASTAGYVNTPPAISAPTGQTLSTATTGGSLTAGTYRYAMSFYQSGGETTAPNISTITVPTGTSTNTVTIPLQTKPSDATGWKIYRKEPGDLEFYLLATVTAGTQYVDDGSVTPDCTKKRPTVNTTNGTNKITVSIPAGELPLDARVTAWRVYRTQTAGAYSYNSLVATVTDTTTEGGTDLVTTYNDVGGALNAGIPLRQSATPPPVPQLDAGDIFTAASGRLPSALAPLGVRQFYTFLPDTLSAKTYNQVYIPHDMLVERLDGYYTGANPTGLVQGVAAQGTLTMDTNPSNNDTMTVDTKTYTFQTTLTDVDGNVKIGATLADTQANIVAAFDLTGVAGTDYAASMTAHTSVNMADFATNASVLTAQTKGTAGNSIATTETFTAGTNVFDAATLGTTTAGVDEVSIKVRFKDDSAVDEVQSLYNDAITQNEFQKISNDATGGTFTLSFDGQGPTGAIDYDAPADGVKEEVTLYNDATSGTFTLTDGTDTTNNIDYNAAAATVKTRLETDITAITTVTVTGAGTSSDPWVITYDSPLKVPFTDLSANDGGLTGGTSTLTVTAQGQRGIKSELEKLSNITEVSVSGSGTSVDPWIVEFINPGDQDVALITADDTNLTGETVGTTITTSIPGSNGGTFTLSDGTDTTSAIAYNASAATIETRLETDITSITNVTVTGSGTSADPWLITFVNPGDQDVDLLDVSDASLNGTSTIAETTKGRGVQQVDLLIDQNQAYHYYQTPTDDSGEQEAESSPATGGTQVSDTLATNDAAAELDTQSEVNSWNIGTGPGEGTYTFRFWVAAPGSAEATMRVKDGGVILGSLVRAPDRNTYDDPVYEIIVDLDGTEDLTVEVEKTDAGSDVVRVDKYEYELQLPTLYGGQTMTVEVVITGTPTTNGGDLQVTMWY